MLDRKKQLIKVLKIEVIQQEPSTAARWWTVNRDHYRQSI